MNEKLSETQEQKWSERFDLGVQEAEDEREEHAFQLYRFIQGRLSNRPVPTIDKTAMARRMAHEMRSQRRSLWDWILCGCPMNRPVLVMGCFVLLAVFAFIYYFNYSHPVTQADFIAEATGEHQNPSWLWKSRLQRGHAVTVPENITAKLLLSDGSIVSCSPRTQIAVRIETCRDITLHNGAITVQTAEIPGSTMTVRTPVVDVAVVGTIFGVELTETQTTTAKVSVESGRVLLIKGTERQILSAGEQAIVDSTQIAVVTPKPTPRISEPAITIATAPQSSVSAQPIREEIVPDEKSATTVKEETTTAVPSLPTRHELRGKVVDAKTGAPIAGAEIYYRIFYNVPGVETEKVEAKTKNDGSFILQGSPGGFGDLSVKDEAHVRIGYDIRVAAEGFVIPDRSRNRVYPEPLSSLELKGGPFPKEITVRLKPGCSATVRVLDPEKQPIANANVQIFMRDYSNAYRPLITDANGQCSVSALPSAPARARAYMKPYGEKISDEFRPGPSDQPTVIELVLPRGASVSGRVTDSEGNPIEKCSVTAVNVDALSRFADTMIDAKYLAKFEIETDKGGNYRLEGLGEGEYSISVYSREMHENPPTSYLLWREVKPQEVSLTAGQEPANIDFVVQRMRGDHEIRGTVVNDSGQPVANAEVYIRIYLAPGIEVEGRAGSIDIRTNEQGEFHATGLSKGKTFYFSVHADGYQYYDHEYDMTGEPLIITLFPTGSIRGVVLNKETKMPISGATVRLVSGIGYGRNSATSSEDGIFLLEKVQPGTYQIVAKAEGFAETRGPILNAKPGETVDRVCIELKPGKEFMGILVDSDGNPIGGASIKLYSDLTDGEKQFTIMKNWSAPGPVVSSQDGTFRVGNVSPDGDVLFIFHDSFVRRQFKITPEMIEKDTNTIVLTKGAVIEGTVVGIDGNPAENVRMRIHGASDPYVLYAFETETNENGYYHFDNLPNMQFYVVKSGVMRDGADQERKFVLVKEGETIRVDFGGGEGAVIRGTIYKGDTPMPNAQVRISDGRQPWLHEWRRFTLSDENGNYVFRGIPEGEAVIEFTTRYPSGDDDPEGIRRITISREQIEYDVDLHARSYEIYGTVTDAETGQPLSGVKIRRFQESLSDHPYVWMCVSDNQGKFSMKMLELGCELLAGCGGYDGKVFSINPDDRQENGGAIVRIPADISLKKADTFIHAHLFCEGEPVVSSEVFFSVESDKYANERVFKSSQLPDQPGTYLIQGVGDGHAEIRARCFDGHWDMESYRQSVYLEKGQTGFMFINLYRMVMYQLDLKSNDGERIWPDFEIEVPDFPEAHVIQPRMRHPSFRGFLLPRGRHAVRLNAPGYRMVEFVPADLALFGSPSDGFLTLELERE
ncbi:MAG: carboxypeptidase regulatory-like domain-containing protein [bacterium]